LVACGIDSHDAFKLRHSDSTVKATFVRRKVPALRKVTQMTRQYALALGIAVASLAFSASAQNTMPPPQKQITCADFARNPNGSWSPTHPININGVSMGTGVSFTAGTSFGGLDIAAWLNANCVGH
jgi:hypothetical protein